MKYNRSSNNTKHTKKTVVSSRVVIGDISPNPNPKPSPHIKKHQLKRRKPMKAVKQSNNLVSNQKRKGNIKNSSNDSLLTGSQNKHEQQQQKQQHEGEKEERIINFLTLILKVEAAIQIYLISTTSSHQRKLQNKSHTHEINLHKFRSIIRKAISSEMVSFATHNPNASSIDEFESLEIDEKIIVLFLFITNYDVHNTKGNNNQNESRKILSYSKDLSKIAIHQNTTFATNVIANNATTVKTKRQTRMDVITILYRELCHDASQNKSNIHKKWKQNKEHRELVQFLSKQVGDYFSAKVKQFNLNDSVKKNTNSSSNSQSSSSRNGEKKGHESKIAAMANKLFGKKNNEVEKKEQQSKQSVSSNSSKIVEPYIKANMTLEERVRARAEHSRLSQCQYMSKQKENGNSTTTMDHDGKSIATSSVNGVSNGLILESSGGRKRKHTQISPQKPIDGNHRSTQISDSSLVRFADALRLYVRHLTNRSRSLGRIGNHGVRDPFKATNEPPKFISVALNEVRRHLKRVVVGGTGPNSSSSTTISTSVGLSEKRFTSKEVTEVIKRLCQSVPEWVSMSVKKMKSSSGSSRKNNTSSSAILRICENVPYQSIREKLGADSRTFRQKQDIAENKKDKENSDQKKRKRDDGFDLVISNKAKESESLKTNNKSSNSSCKTEQTIPALPCTHNTGSSNNGNTRKRSKLSLSARRNNNSNNSNSNSNSNNNNNTPTKISPPGTSFMSTLDNNNNDSEDDNDEDPAALLLAAGIQQTPTVRMNHNQHLTGADVDGGEVIHSTSTNPRGLKRMFSMLNAGDRI